MDAVVAELLHYPIKGCGGVSVDRAELREAGIEHDRGFVLTSGRDGRFITQRTHPVLATVRPRLSPDGTKLTLRAPGADTLVLDVDPDAPRRQASVWSWHGQAADQGDDPAAWFSHLVGAEVRLLHTPRDFDRRSPRAPGVPGGRVRFADAYALLIASESSLDALNERIAERGGEPVPMARFRPNVVVRGWPRPHAEDTAGHLLLGAAEVAFAKVCQRCAVPLVDQDTGAKSGPEPLRTLADYRRLPSGGVTFGANYVVLRPGQVAVGDPVIAHS